MQDFLAGWDYSITCSSEWDTAAANVTGWVGADDVSVTIVSDSSRRWRLNGLEVTAVAGCMDIDLNFSPSTNLLPIRRLNLAIGELPKLRLPGCASQAFSSSRSINPIGVLGRPATGTNWPEALFRERFEGIRNRPGHRLSRFLVHGSVELTNLYRGTRQVVMHIGGQHAA